ncbi:MAG: hypothetical protein JWP89_2593 [Schlesneria sp.]|nr:hypothetical protein [Schlesneria sp.]
MKTFSISSYTIRVIAESKEEAITKFRQAVGDGRVTEKELSVSEETVID